MEKCVFKSIHVVYNEQEISDYANLAVVIW